MPTTYVAAITLAERSRVTDTNPRGWVRGFDTDPAKFLQDRAQPFADAGTRLLFHRAFGAGGKTKTFSKRFDGQPASVTVVEWCNRCFDDQAYALSNFIESSGMAGTFLYVGAPDINSNKSLDGAAFLLEVFRRNFPGCIPIYDNVGDIDSSELCAGSALFAAHDAMDRVPFNSPVAWGIEPNPARDSVASPLDFFGSVRYVYGSVRNWDAKSRYSIEGVAHEGITPIVAIRGDEYKTPDERLAVAREWGPRVAPYNGIVVVHGVSVAEMEGLSK